MPVEAGAAFAPEAGAGSFSGPFCPQAVASSDSAMPVTSVATRAAPARSLDTLADLLVNTQRFYAAMSDENGTALTDAEFHRLTAAVLAAIEADTDRWLQEDRIDIDTHRTGGLLELQFPDGSRIVVNTQPPLHELWLASRKGGYHFRHVGGRWVDTRDGAAFHDVLSREASAQAGAPLRFSVAA